MLFCHKFHPRKRKHKYFERKKKFSPRKNLSFLQLRLDVSLREREDGGELLYRPHVQALFTFIPPGDATFLKLSEKQGERLKLLLITDFY